MRAVGKAIRSWPNAQCGQWPIAAAAGSACPQPHRQPSMTPKTLAEIKTTVEQRPAAHRRVRCRSVANVKQAAPATRVHGWGAQRGRFDWAVVSTRSNPAQTGLARDKARQDKQGQDKQSKRHKRQGARLTAGPGFSPAGFQVPLRRSRAMAAMRLVAGFGSCNYLPPGCFSRVLPMPAGRLNLRSVSITTA